MTTPDGMIAAIVRINGGRLATRNLPDFETTALNLSVHGISEQFVGR